MPTFEHEALVELFQHRHLLAVELAEVHGLKLPAWQAAVTEPTEAPDTVSSRNADAVIKLTDDTGRAVFALVVEVQRGRDDDKQWSWPLYLAGVRHRLNCPAAVLVICTDETTATWAYKPVVLGPGSIVSPFLWVRTRFRWFRTRIVRARVHSWRYCRGWRTVAIRTGARCWTRS